MTTAVEVAMAGCVLVVAAGMIYQILANVFLRDWLNAGREMRLKSVELPPVTFLRPLKANPPELARTLDLQAGAMQARDQLLLGVESGTEAAAEAERFCRRWPDLQLTIVPCEPGRALNPKISKLLQMTPHARHELLILADSEARLNLAETDAFRREWTNSGAGAMTSGYRFSEPVSSPARCDAAAVLLTLWPGLAWVRRFGRMRLTLGACTALQRADVEAIGGWSAVADDLAEDNRIGAALVVAGRDVRLSAGIVTLVGDPMTWTDYWRHQRRIAVTYRVSSPRGFAGSILTHNWIFALICIALSHPISCSLGLLLLVGTWLVRWMTAREMARMTGSPVRMLGGVVAFASVVETACWAASWFSRRVWWSGRWWKVSRTGKLAGSVGS